MAVLNRALRTFDAASLTASFQDVGAVVEFPVSKGALINTSDVDMLLTDGSTRDDIRIPANGTVNVGEGLSSYGQQSSTDVLFCANVQLQVKQVTASGTGNLILNLFG